MTTSSCWEILKDAIVQGMVSGEVIVKGHGVKTLRALVKDIERKNDISE